MSITTVIAAGDVCLPSIRTLANDLRAAFATQGAVRLDLSHSIAPDLSVLQVIESARGAARRGGRDFALSAPVGDAFRTVLDRAGLLTTATPDDHRFWFHGELTQ